MSAEYRGPPALMEVAVEAKSDADREKLDLALGEMAAEDPSFGFNTDWESGQTLLKGTDEWHLDRKIDVLVHAHGVAVNVGAPQVAYRETISCAAVVDHTYKKLTGVSGQFARVALRFDPGEPDSGFMFTSTIADGAVPDEFVRGVVRGLEVAREKGLLAGFTVTDFTATLFDAAYHDIDSSELAFEIAAREAFGKLREHGAPRLLEPIMKIEVLTPDEYLGDVIGDLNSRRGKILGAEQRDDTHLVAALVPLSNMFGYMGVVRSLFDGRAQFSMQYDHYAPTPLPNPEPPTFPPAIGMRA